MKIQPIVEGQGDEAAVPLLLRRLRDEARAWQLEVGRPHRRRRTQLVKKDSLQGAVRVAALREDCAGILVLFDADDDCPKEPAPTLEEWAREAAGGRPCAVVMANREYEAWFLASIEALRGTAAILPDAVWHPDPEVPRDAKGELERRMAGRVRDSGPSRPLGAARAVGDPSSTQPSDLGYFPRRAWARC